jgi:hypothetical protein
MSLQDRFDDKVSEVHVDLFRLMGCRPFVASGDEALALRKEAVLPSLLNGKKVVVDCTGIENMTDSFSNAFFGPLCADWVDGGHIKFKGCTPLVQSFIMTAWQMELRRREKNA